MTESSARRPRPAHAGRVPASARAAGALLAALSAPCPAPARGQEIDTLAIRAHTYFLAHDLLAGRGTGTAGEALAATYIVSELRRMGIPGAGPGGSYLQPVPLKEARIDDDGTAVVLAGVWQANRPVRSRRRRGAP